jgi:hypothetical protein
MITNGQDLSVRARRGTGQPARVGVGALTGPPTGSAVPVTPSQESVEARVI